MKLRGLMRPTIRRFCDGKVSSTGVLFPSNGGSTPSLPPSSLCSGKCESQGLSSPAATKETSGFRPKRVSNCTQLVESGHAERKPVTAAALLRHAERFGLDGVTDAALDLGYSEDQLTELIEGLDKIEKKLADRRKYQAAPKRRLSARTRARKLLGVEETDTNQEAT